MSNNYQKLSASTASLNDVVNKFPQAFADLSTIKEKVQSLEQSTTVTTATTLPADGIPKPNVIYKLGTISRLNFTKGVPNDVNESVLMFTTATSGCEILIASSQKYIGTLATKPSTSYVLSIQNGIIIMAPIA